MSGGYCNCACRDCFEIAISDDDKALALCHACRKSGCDETGESECCSPTGYDDDLRDAAWRDWHEHANIPVATFEYIAGQLQLADLDNPLAVLTWNRRP